MRKNQGIQERKRLFEILRTWMKMRKIMRDLLRKIGVYWPRSQNYKIEKKPEIRSKNMRKTYLLTSLRTSLLLMKKNLLNRKKD